jgi:hypothetical protein
MSGAGLFPILGKGWVGMQRVPIPFRFFLARMRHKVDECVRPGGIIVGYLVADNFQVVLGG